MRMKDLGELGFIERIKGRLPAPSSDVVVSVGDDAAIFKGSNGKFMAATVDTLIENVHFDLSFTSPYELGRKSIAVNLSDMAAVAAEPKHLLISLGVRGDLEVDFFDRLYDGFIDEATAFGAGIIGGDTVTSPNLLSITITLIGEVEPKLLATRSGAKVGDLIMVTGSLGNSSGGLMALKKGLSSPKELIERHLLPIPRIKEARELAGIGINALADISDGLASEINHIAKMSCVGAEILFEMIPRTKLLEEFALSQGKNLLDLILSGGEDYELILTAPTEKFELLKDRLMNTTGTELNAVGKILPKAQGVSLILDSGDRRPLPPLGYQHFKGERDDG